MVRVPLHVVGGGAERGLRFVLEVRVLRPKQRDGPPHLHKRRLGSPGLDDLLGLDVVGGVAVDVDAAVEHACPGPVAVPAGHYGPREALAGLRQLVVDDGHETVDERDAEAVELWLRGKLLHTDRNQLEHWK